MRKEDTHRRDQAHADFRRHMAAFAAVRPGNTPMQMHHKHQAALAVARTGFARGFTPQDVRSALADFCYSGRRDMSILDAHEVFLAAVRGSTAEWEADQR